MRRTCVIILLILRLFCHRERVVPDPVTEPVTEPEQEHVTEPVTEPEQEHVTELDLEPVYYQL